MEQSTQEAKMEMLIRKPIQEVFEAFVDPAVTSRFWFTRSSAKLEEGRNLVWTWEMYDLNVPVKVLDIASNERIRIQWGEGQFESKVEWTFKTLDGDKTFVTIRNYDFKAEGEDLAKLIIDSTGGFTLVLAGLKAWLEHGIELNLVGDKYPIDLLNS